MDDSKLEKLRALADNIASHIWTDVLGKRGDYDGNALVDRVKEIENDLRRGSG